MSAFVPLKRRACVQYGLGQPPPLSDDGVAIIRATNIFRGRIVANDLIRTRVEDLPLDRAPLLKVGEVLVVRSGAYTGDSALITPDWVGSAPGYDLRVTPGHELEPRFIAYTLLGRRAMDQIDLAKSRAAQPHLNAEDLGEVSVLDAPISTQRAIADYLDRETARIDALVAAKRRMTQMLDERFDTFAHLASIGGVGAVERRRSPSGVYGVIPSAWTETPLRHLGCEVQTGPFGSQLHAEEYVEDGWPVVNPMNLIDGRITSVAGMAVSAAKQLELSRHALAEGDIVFGRRGEMGRAGLAGTDQVGWLCGTGSLRLRLTTAAVLPEYLLLLLRTPPAKAYFSLSSVGSTMENLNSEIVLAFPTLVPSTAEQLAIVEEVQDASSKRERLVAVLRRQVALLRERRQALITAAVTGQLDIPEAA